MLGVLTGQAALAEADGFIVQGDLLYLVAGLLSAADKLVRQGVGVAALAGAGGDHQNMFAHCISSSLMVRITFAGTPLTMVFSGTSLVTTAPAATMAPSPMVTPGRMVALEPIQTRLPM